MLVAVALSTGALIASIGISATASAQIGSDIAATTLDEVTVSVRPVTGDDADGEDTRSTQFPDDAEDRAQHLDLVEAAGRVLDTTTGTAAVVTRERRTSTDSPGAAVSLLGATPGYLTAARVTTEKDRTWYLDGTERVAFLGENAARLLDIPVSSRPTGYQVWIGDEAYQIAGFLTSNGSTDLSAAVVIPYRLAVDLVGSDTQTQMLVRTKTGAGSVVAGVIREQIRPDQPERLEASQVQSMESLRRGVSTQLGRLAAGIGAFLAVLTALLIANSMIVSVVARTTEIGLRRALGASRRAVSAVFLCEGAVVGALGGLAGGALSAVLVVTVAAANQWSAVLHPLTAFLGPVLGALIGLASSAYPASRAARISPAIAVRSD
ncbi:ABC transporter permease [Promicromonospora sp. NPDC052451]|uniref:ABC transporter permease n=1 Tax=Promicromonospora sp. NPDC052451 TaxID=3364407 RepID=UPI0037C68FEE